MSSAKLRFRAWALAAATFIPIQLACMPARGEESPGNSAMQPFWLPWDDASPGPADVSFLLDPPAGGRGPVTVRDGHFFTGDRRIRFWGVNLCFAGCFPTHEEASKIAGRLAKFGVNCVRFHHMDMGPFPQGIFKDERLEDFSPEAAGGPLRWDLEEGRGRYVVDAPAVKAVCGSLKAPLDMVGARVEIEGPLSASLVLASIDGAPLESSRKMLLVACGRCENTGMGWNKDRTSVGDQWGRGPVLIEVVRGRVEVAGAPAKVFALDGRGQKAAEIAAVKTARGFAFALGREGPTLWYAIER